MGSCLYAENPLLNEADKLNYLFAHHQKILTSLQELKESNFKTIQSKLVKEKVQLIKKSLQTKGI